VITPRRVSPKKAPDYFYEAWEATPDQYEDLVVSLGELGSVVQLFASNGAYVGVGVPTPVGSIRVQNGAVVVLTDEHGNIVLHSKADFDKHFVEVA
jgi:hypothetical protein